VAATDEAERLNCTHVYELSERKMFHHENVKNNNMKNIFYKANEPSSQPV